MSSLKLKRRHVLAHVSSFDPNILNFLFSIFRPDIKKNKRSEEILSDGESVVVRLHWAEHSNRDFSASFLTIPHTSGNYLPGQISWKPTEQRKSFDDEAEKSCSGYKRIIKIHELWKCISVLIEKYFVNKFFYQLRFVGSARGVLEKMFVSLGKELLWC